MSVLVVGAAGALGEAVVTTLVADGDEVRVVETDAGAGERWRELGAHVAYGPDDDDDLIERAAQNVRTVVVLAPTGSMRVEAARAAIEGARRATVGTVRIVLCGGRLSDEIIDLVRESSLDFVVLRSGRRRLPSPRSPDAASIAVAVSASDDIPGDPRLDLDLTTAEGWQAVGLRAPFERPTS